MSIWKPKRCAILGVGLLGGSIGLAVRRAFPRAVVAGAGRRQSSLDGALQRGCCHEATLDPAEAVAGADLVVLATPVGAFGAILEQIAPSLKSNSLVTDAGSTKAHVVRTAERILGRGGAFVGSHPMAGNENKGPQFATADLLDGALCILTPTKHTPESRTRRAKRFWESLGMRTTRMSPADHDRATARVSHLPHALAAALTLVPTKADLPVAATGFRDTTRLAGGDPEMWRDIMTSNRRAILAALDRLDDQLANLRDLLELDDAEALERFFARAQRQRRTLDR
jgi:prephenate dehydrogenase